jgi:predicted O-linked N-acetylglucosamine transferase (SPINDLY family)
MGVMECVAETAEEYVEIAVCLGTDRKYRERIRARIRSAAGVLFEDLESVREFERFLLTAVRRSRSTNTSRKGHRPAERAAGLTPSK